MSSQPGPQITEVDDEKKESLELQVSDNGDPIVQDNKQMCELLKKSLNVVAALPLPVQTDPRLKLAITFSRSMEENSKDLIQSQSTLRQSMQQVMKVLQYAPIKFDDDNKEIDKKDGKGLGVKQKERWALIHRSAKSIRDTVIEMMDCGAEWFGFLRALDHGLAYFLSTMMHSPDSPDLAMRKFANVSCEFEEFQQTLTEKIIKIRKVSHKSMDKIAKTFGGEQQIRDARKNLNDDLKKYNKAMEELKDAEMKKLEVLMPIYQEIARLEGLLEQYKIQEKFANGEVSDLEKEMKNAQERADAIYRKADTAVDVRKELWVRTSGWWWNRRRTEYYKDVHTGEKSRLEGTAARYKKMKEEAGGEKAAKQKLLENATRKMADTRKLLNAKKDELAKVKKVQQDGVDLMVDLVTKAKKKWEADRKIIEEAVKKFCVNEHSVADFLNAAMQLGGPATMNVMGAGKEQIGSTAARYKKMKEEAGGEKAAKQKLLEDATRKMADTQKQVADTQKLLAKVKKVQQDGVELKVALVTEAKKKCEDDRDIIQEAVKKFCVGEDSVADFMNAAMQLGGPATMNVMGAAKTIEVNMKTLRREISSQCEAVFTVREYFQRYHVELEHLIEPLEKEKYLTMGDLEMDKDEFEEEIKPLLEQHAKKAKAAAMRKRKESQDSNDEDEESGSDESSSSKKSKKQMKSTKGGDSESDDSGKENQRLKRDARKLQKVCCNKSEIKKRKEKEEKLAEINTKNLMMQMPVLCGFFPSLHDRLKFAWTANAICGDDENKSILDSVRREVPQLCWKEEAKLKAIKAPKNDDDEDSNQKKGKKKSKKKRSRDTASDESDADSDADSDSDSDGGKRRKKRTKDSKKKKGSKKGKHEKKRKRKKSQDSSDEDEESGSDESSSSKKSKRPKKSTKKKKRKKSSESEEESESDGDHKKSKKKNKRKKRKKESDSDDASDSDTKGSDSESDDSGKKKKKRKSKKLVKETLTLVKVIGDEFVKCINDDFEKVKFEIDGDEWTDKLNKLLKKGKKKKLDVKLTVSSIGDDDEKEYQIIKAFLDASDDED
eukprot:CAMPEP_0197077060 /NCGR_PEP_ID=MMETSP1384-20130603/212421_1 /TAXON_ID=29189 /ORGANISM="Ammonia sp." /LENGTH=1057 /DNA_ID=CAMNT_0042515919 /DNA_START=2426 /DNA_END=5600 /DNA_ORIENTATION=-